MNNHNITKIRLTDIKPAEYNPRYMSTEDKNKLKKSLLTFGLVDPIIINLKNNTIIGGHQRYDVLLDLELDNPKNIQEYNLLPVGDIGFIYQNNLQIKNEDYEKALNIALNNIEGEWDYSKLTNVLETLKLNHFDLTITGFDNIDTPNFDLDIPSFDLEDEKTEKQDKQETIPIIEDDYEEPEKDDIKVHVAKGDLYKLGNHYLFCGDATNKEDVEILMSAEKGGGAKSRYNFHKPTI